MQCLADLAHPQAYFCYTGTSTIPIRSRSCRITRTRSAASSLLRAFCCPCTTHRFQVCFLHSFQPICRPCRPSLPIPIQPPSVTGILSYSWLYTNTPLFLHLHLLLYTLSYSLHRYSTNIHSLLTPPASSAHCRTLYTHTSSRSPPAVKVLELRGTYGIAADKLIGNV